MTVGSIVAPAAIRTSRYVSVLFADEPAGIVPDRPDYFTDLNLDQLIRSVLTGRDSYDLAEFFDARLTESADVGYRQAVLRDLEDDCVAGALTGFAERMSAMRDCLRRSRKLRYRLQRRLWWLAAADNYRAAVDGLADCLAVTPTASDALATVRDHLVDYRAGQAYVDFETGAERVAEALRRVSYRLQIHGDRVQVSRPTDDEGDYAADVAATFERFRIGAATSYRVKLPTYPEMNHVEEAIADRVALLFPEPFDDLAKFCIAHEAFVDDAVARLDREIQFYLAWREFTQRLTTAGLPVCYPEIVGADEGLEIVGGYDVALADQFVRDRRTLVPNSLQMSGTQRVVVVTGPNQGGKTTYARMIAQLHHLAALGLTVPAERAALALPDMIGTHFERGENLDDLTGKLDDDLVRIHSLLAGATERSLVILNEIFTSTTADDALWLSSQVLDRIRELGCRSACVTFLDELAARAEDTISMVAEIDPADTSRRTLRLVGRPADGKAYATALAARYGLTTDVLERRLGR